MKRVLPRLAVLLRANLPASGARADPGLPGKISLNARAPRLGRRVTALAKFAEHHAAFPDLPGARKFWLQEEFAL